MKLILVRQRIGARFGGAEGYVAMLAGALRARGASVTLLAQAVDEEAASDGFTVRRVPSWPTNVGGVLSFARAVRREFAAARPAAFLSFDRIPGVPFIRAGDGVHAAYLESMGQTFSSQFSVKHQVLLSLERRAFTHPDLRCVFANSKMVAGDLRRRYGVPEEKIRVVYTGLADPGNSPVSKSAARAELGLPVDAKVVLFAGHNYERKGLGTLIHAFALARVGAETDGRILLVAGRGDVRTHEALARRLGIGGAVRFLGPCDLARPFSAADLFVLPTRYDPLARVCLEASRAGLPVITTRRNGFSEWVAEPDRFVLDPPDNIAGLTRLLRGAFGSDLAAAGARQREKTKNLTIDQNAKEILSCLGY